MSSRVRPRPRSAPATTDCVPSNSWNARRLEQRHGRGDHRGIGGERARDRARARARTRAAKHAITLSPSASPSRPRRRASARSPAPVAWPTRTDVALATPTANENVKLAMLSAMLCAAAGSSPRCAGDHRRDAEDADLGEDLAADRRAGLRDLHEIGASSTPGAAPGRRAFDAGRVDHDREHEHARRRERRAEHAEPGNASAGRRKSARGRARS